MENLYKELIKSNGKYSSRRWIAYWGFILAACGILINAIWGMVWAVIWGTATAFMPVETSIILALLGIGTAGVASAGFGKNQNAVMQTKKEDVIEP